MPFLIFQSIGLDELLFLLLWVAPILATVRIAEVRGRSPSLWGIAAAFLPYIALVVVALLPRGRPASSVPR